MRRHVFRILGLGAALAIAVSAGDHASAQSFPGTATATAFFVPVTRNGAPVTDGTGGAGNPRRDVVGDTESPALYVASDATHLFFRIRVDGDPGTPPEWENDGWGCMFDVNGNDANYELLLILDGERNVVSYRHNSTVGGDTTDNRAETELANFPEATFARRVAAPSNFSGNADWFVDLAVPWATIRGGAQAVAAGTPMRFICGATSDSGTSATNQARRLDSDVANGGGGGAATLSATWSDAYVCNTGANPRCTTAFDSDGDGVPDAAEAGFGTSPNDIDSDGDGIRDDVELTPPSGLLPYAAVDSDGDGVIDALDTDSDNDCVPDASEDMATFRSPALPNANPSAACPGTTPICDVSRGVCVQCSATNSAACVGATAFCDVASGTCVGCNGDYQSGASRSCAIDAPACHVSGPLAGRCTQCKPGLTTQCLGATPACSTETGTCVACNGHRGSGATAACPNAAAPACQLSGPLAGRCTICSINETSLCTGATPACDPASGTCAPCDGDRGSGASRACPDAANPYCHVMGTSAGTCGKCTNSDECGGLHPGPTCDVATGACVDVDTDGDGLQDAAEILIGTDPTKRDSDGDGIDDLTEVTPAGGGAPTKVDTDGDGTIDALDLDSDDDGIPDAEEAFAPDAGTLIDTDRDGTPNWRDDDDDNDLIKTKDEVADTLAAKVSDDVDGDGQKNWVDSDADGDGVLDGFEGRGDKDGDGVPDYLDPVDDPSGPDAGPPPDAGGSSSSSSSGSSGSSGAPEPPDAGSPAAVDDGVLEGTGLLCSSSHGTSSPLVLVAVAAAAAAVAARRRRDPEE